VLPLFKQTELMSAQLTGKQFLKKTLFLAVILKQMAAT
jgi:hypothetical protein